MLTALMMSMMPVWVRDLIWWLLDNAFVLIGVEGHP
jgi:hypothetical protein